MSRPLPEIALTEDEIDQILQACQGRAVLVGDQALAFWAQHYAVTPVGVLSANVTSDVDFLGSAQVPRELAQALKRHGKRRWPKLLTLVAEQRKAYAQRQRRATAKKKR